MGSTVKTGYREFLNFDPAQVFNPEFVGYKNN